MNNLLNSGKVDNKNEIEISKIKWVPWEKNLAKQYVDKGFVVFIDFTASWCVICQINKNNIFFLNWNVGLTFSFSELPLS